MEKIIRAALTAKFSSINIEALLEVIKVTPNPQIATEILLGVYEPPIIQKYGIVEDNVIAEFISYNKFTEEVTYKYTPYKKLDAMVSISVKNPTEADIICLYSKRSSFNEPSEGWKNVYIPTSELSKETTNEMALSSWNKKADDYNSLYNKDCLK